jgi:glycosyltransferase 2 family protein
MTERRSALRRVLGSYAFRIAVSLVLLVAVLSRVDLRMILNQLGDGRPELFLLAVAAIMCAVVIGGVRWHAFLAVVSVAVSYRDAVKAFFAGAFATNFLPASVGGDLVRGWVAAKPGSRARAFASVVVDRASVLGCAFVLAWIAALLADDVPATSIRILGVTTIVFAVVAALLVLVVLLGTSRASLRRFVPDRLVPVTRDFGHGLRTSLDHPRVFVSTTLTGVAYQVMIVTGTWLLAMSVDVELAFSAVAIVLPSVLILAAMPISIGGLGVRELAFVTLLVPYGVSTTDATLVSLLAGAAYVLATAPGALMLLAGRRDARAAILDDKDASGTVIAR